MTTDYVLAYVPRKMRELGVNENYALAFRELVIKPNGEITIDAQGQYYFFVGGFTSNVSIKSETGVYDLTISSINESIHEHTGKIKITSRTSEILHLQFVVVIPNN